jgi:hypothetical protein
MAKKRRSKKQYFINGFEVSKDTFKQYLDKEFKRIKCNCKDFDESLYKVHENIILNGIEFRSI